MKTHNKLINLSILVSLLMALSITNPTFANTSANVDEMYNKQFTQETLRMSVEKMHQEVYTRLKSIQADKTDELKSEFVSQ